MTNNTQKIELYTPQHYLVNLRTMAEEALAVVSDEDINKYEEEHAVYLTKQKEATKIAFKMIEESKEAFEILFGGRNSNEHKLKLLANVKMNPVKLTKMDTLWIEKTTP